MKITKKVKKIEEKLKALVEAEYKHSVVVEVRQEPGPFGINVITACNPKAHPGTGIKRVLIDDGVTYGQHGEQDLADLIRQKGLMTATDVKLFLRLVNIAYFEGIALLVNPEPKFVKTGSSLEFRFFRTLHPSGKRVEVIFQVGPVGPAVIK